MHARPLRRLGAAPACANHGGSRDREDFGARSHGIGTRCLRFAGRVTPPPRKTHFRLLAKLCRAGFVHPQGCHERFPRSSLFLLVSSLPEAMTPFIPSREGLERRCGGNLDGVGPSRGSELWRRDGSSATVVKV